MSKVWDRFTVRLWAMIHVKKYRDKVLLNTVFIAAIITVLYKIAYALQGGKFSPAGVLFFVTVLTVAMYIAVEKIISRRNRKADSTTAAIDKINIIVHKLNKLVNCKVKENEQ